MYIVYYSIIQYNRLMVDFVYCFSVKRIFLRRDYNIMFFIASCSERNNDETNFARIFSGSAGSGTSYI